MIIILMREESIIYYTYFSKDCLTLHLFYLSYLLFICLIERKNIICSTITKRKTFLVLHYSFVLKRRKHYLSYTMQLSYTMHLSYREGTLFFLHNSFVLKRRKHYFSYTKHLSYREENITCPTQFICPTERKHCFSYTILHRGKHCLSCIEENIVCPTQFFCPASRKTFFVLHNFFFL